MCTGPEQVQSTLPPKKLGIHPITIISIVDHINRARIYKKHEGVVSNIVGLLLGKKNETEHEAKYSFILDLKFDGINKEYLEERVEHHKSIFQNDQIVGWYSNNLKKLPDELVLSIHKQLSKPDKKLVYLHASIDHNDINTEGGINNIAKSDVSKYFCAYVLTEDQEGQPPHFESIPLELKSDVAEFVALDEITNSANTEGNENEVVTQMENVENQISAVQMLRNNLLGLRNYIDTVLSGQVKETSDYHLVKALNEICINLPNKQSTDELYNHSLQKTAEYAKILEILTGMTESTHNLSEISELTSQSAELVRKYGLKQRH